MPDIDELHHRFAYHPADEQTGQRHGHARAACELAADTIVAVVPPSREQALALTKLEEAMFWANAGIARAAADRSGPATSGADRG